MSINTNHYIYVNEEFCVGNLVNRKGQNQVGNCLGESELGDSLEMQVHW